MPHPRSAQTLGLVMIACSLACGGGGSAGETGKKPEAVATSGGEPRAGADPRALPSHSTFADLVDAARTLDDNQRTHSDQGCLLRGTQIIRLEADVLAGIRPLPSPPDELAKRLEASAQPVTVLSAWGTLDENPASELSVVAFTTTTPRATRARTFVAFLTKQGIYVRGDDLAVRGQPGALTSQAFGALLAQAATDQNAMLYVTAESGVQLTQLREALLAVPNRYELGLAVALPARTQLPGPAKPSNEALCPDGLPAPPDDEPEGDLAAAALQTALAPLRDAALQCATSSGGRALIGGKLVLALRIDPSGHARDACLVQDAIGDATLRRCLIATARSLSFPVPAPKGSVDVQLPLDLALVGPEAQRPLCD